LSGTPVAEKRELRDLRVHYGKPIIAAISEGRLSGAPVRATAPRNRKRPQKVLLVV
jgi:hypothetical protein